MPGRIRIPCACDSYVVGVAIKLGYEFWAKTEEGEPGQTGPGEERPDIN
jgi:hypothetical protein